MGSRVSGKRRSDKENTMRSSTKLTLYVIVATIFLSIKSKAQTIIDSSSHRTNFCSIHRQVERKEISRDNALKGKNITISLWSPIDELNPSMEVRILNEISRRAQFSYIPFYTEKPTLNETWTDVLLRDSEKYDIAVNWWDRTVERITKGIIFPTSWYNSDVIIVMRQQPEEDKFSFFAFARPFSPGLWILTLLTITSTGVLFYFLDFLQAHADRKKMFSTMEGSVFTSFYSFTGSRSVYKPNSRASRLLVISMAFLYLILCAAYTANLTNYYIIKSRPSLVIHDINDVISNSLSICVAKGYANSELFKQKYKQARVREIDTGTSEEELFIAISEGQCDVGLITYDGFNFYKLDKRFNKYCDLEWVGRRVFVAGSGFALADSEELCSSLLDNVLDYHLLHMQMDGVIEDIKEAHREARTSDTCVDEKNMEENKDSSVTILNMGGAFAFHLCLIVISLSLGFYDHYRQPKEIKEHIKNEMNSTIQKRSESIMKTAQILSTSFKDEDDNITTSTSLAADIVKAEDLLFSDKAEDAISSETAQDIVTAIRDENGVTSVKPQGDSDTTGDGDDNHQSSQYETVAKFSRFSQENHKLFQRQALREIQMQMNRNFQEFRKEIINDMEEKHAILKRELKELRYQSY